MHIKIGVNLSSINIIRQLQVQRLKQEATNHQTKVNSLEEDLSLARRTCEAWRTKAIIAEQQRDEVCTKFWTSKLKSLCKTNLLF